MRLLDIETTGMAPPEHTVVEIAALDLIDGALDAFTRSSLVLPNRSIPAEASAVHGITDADVADAPPFDQVLPLVMTDRRPDFVVAHNIAFEKLWLVAELDGIPAICTMKCSMRAWPEAQAFNLSYLRYWLFLGDLGQRANPPHRAPADVFVAAHVLGRLLGEVSVDDMVEWTREPALYPRVPFGKHDGVKWSALPDSYLDWILNKPNDLSDDIKWNARKEVVRRFDEKKTSFVDRACAEARRQPTIAALEAWWDAGARDRFDYDVEKGSPGYDLIVQVCVDHKATLNSILIQKSILQEGVS